MCHSTKALLSSPEIASPEGRPASKRSTVLWLCFGLLAGIAAVYWPVAGFDFILCDDSTYITNNPTVQFGLNWTNVCWAFTTDHANNWHPLTWLSHMLDVQVFGMSPGWHHISNVLFHAANTLLLLWLIYRLTGALYRSAIVAALFALHPLHVESVAWISERKDVLSTFFFLLTLLSYAAYARRSEAESSSPDSAFQRRSTSFYFLALFFFALGLMSKPMLVTLPFILLLLDYWPLGRFPFPVNKTQCSSLLRLTAEKTPFLALSIGSCIATMVVQAHEGNMAALSALPIGRRMENAVLSYLLYLQKMFWPTKLAAYYPYPQSIPDEQLALAAGCLIAITLWAIVSLRSRPFLAVGWFWYLGTLVPVIGLVQVGLQSMADRYTYMPLIGIALAIVWLLGEALRLWKHQMFVLGVVFLASIAFLMAFSMRQVRLWHDTETLYEHALKVTSNNAHAHLNIGSALAKHGRIEEASEHFAEAIRIRPGYAEAHSNLGFALAIQGKLDEAISHYRAALVEKTNRGETHYLLANALSQKGEIEEAIAEYRTALKLKPSHLVCNDLAWILATTPNPQLRNGSEAAGLAEQACKLTEFKKAQYEGTLAAAYAEVGRFTEAVQAAEKAVQLATNSGESGLAATNQKLLELYRAGKPYREKN